MPTLPRLERRRDSILTSSTPISKNLNKSLQPSAHLFSPKNVSVQEDALSFGDSMGMAQLNVQRHANDYWLQLSESTQRSSDLRNARGIHGGITKSSTWKTITDRDQQMR
ncbi:hypothetical protein DPMN_191366 [Dreissena polymorpha]|uniref:Uncharacterized protein n=1 Tax=Dreissena polymorpha TaxID=45954 RepID=A0A9D4BFP7_DREPO|nr:hypothetical protein DPMN_191366 [Dreissena polymorpha]